MTVVLLSQVNKVEGLKPDIKCHLGQKSALLQSTRFLTTACQKVASSGKVKGQHVLLAQLVRHGFGVSWMSQQICIPGVYVGKLIMGISSELFPM